MPAAAITDWASAVSAVAAATAATMAWLNVRHQRRAYAESTQPRIVLQIVRSGNAPFIAALHNAGGGFARGVTYVIEAKGQYVAGIVGIGFMKPGDEWHVEAPLRIDLDDRPPFRAVVTCTDASGTRYITNERLETTSPPTRGRHKVGPMTAEDAFRTWHPDVDLREQVPTLRVAQVPGT
jgi:hypothetical protein